MKSTFVSLLTAVTAAFSLSSLAVDLKPDGLDGWASSLIVSTDKSQTESADSFDTLDTVYVSWGCTATGGSVSKEFKTALYCDGTRIKTWKTSSLSKDGHTYVQNYALGGLAAGTHTLRIEVDYLGSVTETNEKNNSRSVTITVRQVLPFEANTTYRGCVLLGNEIKGYSELKSGKLDKSGTCKLSGYVMLNDGKKISAKAIKVTPTGRELLATLELTGLGNWNVIIGGGVFTGNFGSYRTRWAEIGGVLSAASPAARLQLQSVPAMINNVPVYAALLPLNEPVLLRNGKWAFNKASKIVYASGVATPEISNGRTNTSGLKLTYTPKTGVFKGTFNVYSNAGKLVKTKATVRGVVVNGRGFADVTFAKSSVVGRMRIL